METNLQPEVAFCRHCNSPVPRGRRDEFCCNGCETVFHILASSGLSEYYQLKEGAVCFQKAKPISKSKQDFEFVTLVPQVKFYLEGIHCSACLWLLEKLPVVMPDAVLSCSLSLNTSVLSVTLKNPNHVNEVAGKINDWGYRPHLISAGERVEDRIEKRK